MAKPEFGRSSDLPKVSQSVLTSDSAWWRQDPSQSLLWTSVLQLGLNDLTISLHQSAGSRRSRPPLTEAGCSVVSVDSRFTFLLLAPCPHPRPPFLLFRENSSQRSGDGGRELKVILFPHSATPECLPESPPSPKRSKVTPAKLTALGVCIL